MSGKQNYDYLRKLSVTIILLILVLLVFFYKSLLPGKILFSSDGPLGANAAEYAKLPEAFLGMWQDLNWVGGYVGSAFLSITYLLLWVLGPYLFAKLYTPISLFILGISAYFFFRAISLRWQVCIIGSVATMLVSDFFSYACWGLGTHVLAVASVFVALGIMFSPSFKKEPLLQAVFIGFSSGMAVIEGFDSGAILTLYIAATFIVASWIDYGERLKEEPTKFWIHIFLRRVGYLMVIIVSAFWIAAHACSVLIETQVKNVAFMKGDLPTKERRWDEATQWSLPKIETLRIIIPGLFGYRMDTPNGGQYWGRVGQFPSQPELMPRHSGAGPYVGLMVFLGASWAILLSFKQGSIPFLSRKEKRWIWFWIAVTILSLMLAWGRYAPFYAIFYGLPYTSAIRNPIKFLHPFSIGMVILFAYGLELLLRAYSNKETILRDMAINSLLKQWWKKMQQWERIWVLCMLGFFGIGFVSWLIYGAMRPYLVSFLKKAYLPLEEVDKIASFSISEVGWFVFFFLISSLMWMAIMSGILSGRRLKSGLILFLLVMLVDFYRANLPWVVYWDFEEKYSLNPVIKFLSKERGLNRMAIIPFPISEEFVMLQRFYYGEWLQHSFRYYNIQSLDVVQDPRPSLDNLLYRRKFMSQGIEGFIRMWELTGTKYFIAPGEKLLQRLNDMISSNNPVFKAVLGFDFTIDELGRLTVVEKEEARFAIAELERALPRYKIYYHWEIIEDPDKILNRLSDLKTFDPQQIVLLERDPGLNMPPQSTAQYDHEICLDEYRSKYLRLRVKVPYPAVLLVNDKYDPHWYATIDNKPAAILKANFLMRAIPVEPGEHIIEMRFIISPLTLIVSVSALVVCIILIILKLYINRLWKNN